jgi:hypothetical protein
MSMGIDQLKQEIMRLIEGGDEQALRAFILEHYGELPEEIQAKVLFAFYTEAVERQAGEAEVKNLQTQALDALEKLEQMKKDLSANQA